MQSAPVDRELRDSVGRDIERVATFVWHSLEGLRKAIKKYRKKTGLSDAWYHAERGSNTLHKANEAIHGLVLHLSRLYESERHESAAWVPPSTFERKTIKYWVLPEHAVRVKLFVLRHIPILELTDSRRVSHQFADEKAHDQTHNFVSSVYYDNPAFDCYHRRIQQSEGARLLRIRWYGGRRNDSTELPHPEGRVYVERKTHHESWVGEPSTKERFSFDRALLPGFLGGKIPADEALATMVARGELSDEQAADHLQLAREVQDMVTEEGLVPVLRTVYHRTAFQSKSSNDVRISFDTPCYFFAERNATGDFWRNLRTDRGGIDAFPHGILEVKLTTGSPPLWVDELLRSGWLTPVDKFSKFQTTVASEYPERVRIFPHWIESIEQPDGSELDGETTAVAAAAPGDGAAVPSTPTAAVAVGRPAPRRRVLRRSPGDAERVRTAEGREGRSRRLVQLKKTNLQRTKIEPKT